MNNTTRLPRKPSQGRTSQPRLKPNLDSLEDRRLLSADFVGFGTGEMIVTGRPATLEVAQFAATPNGHVDSATIDWGDGTPMSKGTIDPLANVSFLGTIGQVSGGHTYAKPGSYTVKTTLVEHNTAGDVTVDVTGTITATPVTVTAKPARPVLAAQGQALSKQVVALVQTNAADASKSFIVTIDWGDGSPSSPGSLQPALDHFLGGHDDSVVSSVIHGVDDLLGSHEPDHHRFSYAAVGDHAYAVAGSYLAKVTIDDGAGDTTEADTAVTVAAGTLVAQSPTSLDDLAGTAISGPLARVVDLATGAKPDPSQLSATIDWGDGSTPTVGEVHGLPDFLSLAADHPTYSVSGHHTYAAAGDETVTITVVDKTGRSALATTTVHVKAETLTLTSSAVSATSGLGGLFEVASGTDAPLVHGNHLSATIDWGDGSTVTSGHILPAGWASDHAESRVRGTLSFTVVGEHVYANAGTFKIHVSVTSDAGATATTDGSATVKSFSARGIPKSARAGTAISNGPLAVIALAGGAASPTDFTATIDWGDGSPVDPGAIVAKDSTHRSPTEDFVSPRSYLLVDGTHTFTTAGTFHAKVTITDIKTSETSIITSDILVSAAVIPVGTTGSGDHGTPKGGSMTGGGSPLPITVVTIPPTTGPTGGSDGEAVTVVPVSASSGGKSGQGGSTPATPIVTPTPTVTTSPNRFSKPHGHHPKSLLKIRAAKHPHGPLG